MSGLFSCQLFYAEWESHRKCRKLEENTQQMKLHVGIMNKIRGSMKRCNPIKVGDIRSLVPLVSVREMVSEGYGHADQATLIFFNLIRPTMAPYVLASRNTTHPPVRSEGYSLKHTADESVEHRTTRHNVQPAWPLRWLMNPFIITGNYL